MKKITSCQNVKSDDEVTDRGLHLLLVVGTLELVYILLSASPKNSRMLKSISYSDTIVKIPISNGFG